MTYNYTKTLTEASAVIPQASSDIQVHYNYLVQALHEIIAMVNGTNAGNDVDGNALGNFTGSGLDPRITSLESSAMTIAGLKAFSAGIKTDSITEVTANAGITFLKAIIPSLSSDPGTLVKGMIWFNSTSNVYKFYNGTTTKTLITTDTGPYPTGYHGSAAPVVASTTTITIAFMRERSGDDTVNLTKTGSTTLSTATIGLSGIAQSANLTGTCSTSGSSTTLTFAGIDPRTIFQVGDVVAPSTGAGPRRITALSATTATLESALTVTASSTYKRGGLAPNTWYYLYAVSDGTTPGWILSTRNVAGGDTLVDLPTNYSTTTARQVNYAVRMDGSSLIIPTKVVSGWPYRPTIRYLTDFLNVSTSASTTNVLITGTATSFTGVSCTSYVPSISTEATLWLSAAGAVVFSTRATGSSLANGSQNRTTTGNTPIFVVTDLNSSQSFDYKNDTGTVKADVFSYTITEGN